MVNSESLIHPIILFDSSTTRIRAIETHLSEHFDIIPFYNIKTTLALLDMLGKHHNIVNPPVRTVLALTDCFVEYNPIRQKHEFLSLDFFYLNIFKCAIYNLKDVSVCLSP